MLTRDQLRRYDVKAVEFLDDDDGNNDTHTVAMEDNGVFQQLLVGLVLYT